MEITNPNATRLASCVNNGSPEKAACGRHNASNRAQSAKKREQARACASVRDEGWKRKGKEKLSLRRGATRGLGTDLCAFPLVLTRESCSQNHDAKMGVGPGWFRRGSEQQWEWVSECGPILVHPKKTQCSQNRLIFPDAVVERAPDERSYQ